MHLRAAAQPAARLAGSAPGAPLDRDPTTYYVDGRLGRDSNSGTSPDEPWRTLARVQQGRYRGGDRIRLRAGQRFAGSLRFTPADVVGTSPGAELTLGSYGGGRATVAPARGSGLVATNVTGIRVSGVDFVGRARGCASGGYGLFFDARGVRGTLAGGIQIDHVDVSRFCDGIVIGSEDDGSRIAHIRISAVAAHHNLDAGIFIYDPVNRHHDIRDVRIARVRAFHNDDQGGIVLFGVDGGVVVHSVAYSNGRLGSGGVGIWAFDANRIVLTRDESYGNRTTHNGDDGDGFDLDGGVTNSVIEYSYAHDNAGIGLLVCACVNWWYPPRHNVIRFNISENDGWSGQPSGLYVGGGQRFSGTDVYNNTLYSSVGSGPMAVIDSGGSDYEHVHLWNNLIVAGANKPLLEVHPSGGRDVRLQGNDWWSASGRFEIQWGLRRFNSFSAWRARTGAETLNGRRVGLSRAPKVARLGRGGTVFPRALPTLGAYRPWGGSPLVSAGLDLVRLFGVAVGDRTFSGWAQTTGAVRNIGAQ
jgi:hypothetical protein